MGGPGKQTSNDRSMALATCERANQRFRDLDRLRRDQEAVVRKINRFHQKLSTTAVEIADKYDFWSRLRGLYVQAMALGEEEESLLGSTVLAVEALIWPSGQQSQSQQPQQQQQQMQQQTQPHRKKPASSAGGDPKRKRVNSSSSAAAAAASMAAAAGESQPRAASAAVAAGASTPRAPPPSPHASIAVGDQVAARVSPDDAQNDEWIVVKVLRIDRDRLFEVVDEEPDDDGEIGGRKYTLPAARIIPFPKKLDATTAPDFRQGSHVLAVYPGTTALYKASVVGSLSVGPQQRKKMKLDDSLMLEFDGDEEDGLLPQRPVPLYHIVTLPEGHRQWQS